MNTDIPLCIYHGPACSDGMGAAWVVRKFYKERHGIMPEFFVGQYGRPYPDVTDRDVIIVDFSYPKDVLMEMEKVAKSIVVLDHHKTAAEDLNNCPRSNKLRIVFDMERSGAMLTWNWFFPAVPPIALITRIQDRDLWKFSYPDTGAVMSAVFSYPMEFEIWDELMSRSIQDLANEGQALMRNQKKIVDQVIEQFSHEVVIEGHRVLATNCLPMFASDIGHRLAEGRPFSAMWWESGTTRYYSLRSNAQGIDASEIAKRFGGGGHRNACGFKVEIGSPEYQLLTNTVPMNLPADGKIPDVIIDRYKQMLFEEGCKPVMTDYKVPNHSLIGNLENGDHLFWMLTQIEAGLSFRTKEHRWLGFIQAGLISMSLTTVQQERDFTRDLFNGM